MKKNLYSRIIIFTFLFLCCGKSSFSQIYVSGDSVTCGATGDTIRAVLEGDVPTSAGITEDDVYTSSTIPIGFSFKFYGSRNTHLLIGANGNLCFDLSLAGAYDPWPISAVLHGNSSVYDCICGPWQDLYIPSGGTCTYSTDGTAPYRKFAVTYCRDRMYDCTSLWCTAQIIIYETTNIVEVHIGHKIICSSWNGGYAICGVQNATGSASTAAPSRDYPTDWTATDEAWRFTPDDTSISAYSVSSIAYAPIPYSSSTVYWYDSLTGSYLGSGSSIYFVPSGGDSTVYAEAAGCDDTTRTYFHLSLPALGGGNSPVHITSVSHRDPSVCGLSNGSVLLTGINPYQSDTIFYSYMGTAQPIIVDSAGSDSTLTVAGLCAGVYDYFYVKVGPCPSNTVGPITLTNPGFGISDTSHTNASCSACDGTYTLYGLTPGQSVTVNYNYNGVPQAPYTGTSTGSGTLTITGLCPGNYDNIVASLTACTTGACVSSPVGTITIVPPPLIQIRLNGSSNPTACGACNGTLTITGMAPGTVDTVFYTMDGVSQSAVYSAASDSSVTLYSLCAGIYSNFFVKVGPCPTNTITTNVNIVDPVIVTAFSDFVNYGCYGDTVTFSNTSSTPGGLYYIWHFGDGVTDTSKNPVHIYQQGTYSVTLIATNHHCTDSLSGTISLIHPIQAIFSPSASEICQGTPVDFTNTSVGTPPIYYWSFGDGTTSTSANPSHTYDNVGTYVVQLRATNFVPCMDSVNTTIVVDSQSLASLAVSDTVLCTGNYITLNATYSSIANTGVNWSFGNGDSLKNADPVSYAFQAAGTYVISATATYKVCTPVTVSRSVNVYKEPTIYIGKDTSICLGGETALVFSDVNNAANPLAKWMWSTGETSSSISVNAPGSYFATVTINGCQASDTVQVINDCYISLPNIFTPNGDGVNDYFFPRSELTSGLTTFKMDIYNRWGQLIFETTSIEGRGWDGNFNNTSQPQGVYMYIIDATFKDGTKEHHSGNLTLLR